MTASDLYAGLLGMGMNKGYASQISRGQRKPSLPLSIRIYRAIGQKLGPISGLSEREISTLEKVGIKQRAQ